YARLWLAVVRSLRSLVVRSLRSLWSARCARCCRMLAASSRHLHTTATAGSEQQAEGRTTGRVAPEQQRSELLEHRHDRGVVGGLVALALVAVDVGGRRAGGEGGGGEDV